MGSLFSAPKIESPPAPPPPVDYNTIDKVSGTKSTVVKNSDGTKTVVIEENLTPEQQQIRDNLKAISDQALSKYTALVNDPLLDSMPDIKRAVDTIVNNQKTALGTNFEDVARQTEQTAARFGVADSTAATQFRASNAKNYAGALNQLEADRVGLVNQYRQQEMQNQLGAYGLASGRQDTLLSQGLQTLGLGNQIGLQNAARNDAYQNNLYSNAVNLSIAKANAKAQSLGTLGSLAGTALGFGLMGGLGGFGATGSSVGGAFGGGYSRTGGLFGNTINWYPRG